MLGNSGRKTGNLPWKFGFCCNLKEETHDRKVIFPFFFGVKHEKPTVEFFPWNVDIILRFHTKFSHGRSSNNGMGILAPWKRTSH